jgi:hypothetical protein
MMNPLSGEEQRHPDRGDLEPRLIGVSEDDRESRDSTKTGERV